MSKRYSIDRVVDSDGEEEDGLIYESSAALNDADLIRNDEDMSLAIEEARGLKPKKGWAKRSRRVRFGSKYMRLGDDDDNAHVSDKPHRLETLGNDGRIIQDDSDTDFDSDIEVDLQTHPRRRSRNAAFTRKMHILLLLSVVLAGLLFYSSILEPGAERHRKPHTKRLLSNGTHEFHPTTIVVSLDGMHPHYISEELTPHMHMLFSEEAAAPYMIPAFPSLTFPNHWTLVTGLHPARHGIIGNSFWDPKSRRQFINSKPDLSFWRQWWGGEAIWKTAALQNVKTAVHMWPGSEAHWNDEEKPAIVDSFNGTEVLPKKARRVFEWIDTLQLADRPELILTYVPDVDALGHEYGIHGKEIRQVLKRTDDLIGLLLDGIKERNLENIVNFVVISDHGMAPVSNARLAYLEDLVDLDDFSHVDGAPLIALRPKPDVEHRLGDIYTELKKKEPADKSWTVYRDSNMPAEWKFGGTHSPYDSRIAPLWIIPKVGWAVVTRQELKDMGGTYRPIGRHGYNNTETLMRSIFLAKGPYFEKSSHYAPFDNVDFYNIVCDTLEITPAPNDGSRRTLRPLPHNWVDSQPYPDVDFHAEILKVNATYDLLFSDSHSDGYDDHRAEDHSSDKSEEEDSANWGHRLKHSADKLYHDIKDWLNGIFGKEDKSNKN